MILKKINNFITNDKFLLFIIFLVSFLINKYYANLGAFPIDTFLHFDSGFRILNGEYPIKDFWIVSGIFVDYLLMNRPIIFANFDHEAYVGARGLDWDYKKVTPGPKAENWELLLFYLENIIVHKKDEYQEARQKLRDKIYQYKDSDSCARIVKEIYRIV